MTTRKIDYHVMENALDAASVLGKSGRIAARLDHYEERPEQLEMAEAVAASLDDKTHLLVEAGTGVGKSFAYLVPAILWATSGPKPDGTRRRIVISTHTISLQEQIINRDIPFLNAILPVEFSAVLVKGRSNYMSLRRMRGAVDRSRNLFANEGELSELEQVVRWSSETSDGSRSDLGFQPSGNVWSEVASEHGNCLGKKCPTYDDCFYYKARRRIWNADVLVVNHALFFSDLALRRDGAKILPDYDVAIFDEAHTLEGVAGDHLGFSASNGQIEYLLNKLYNDRTQRGLLVHFNLVDAQQLCAELRHVQRDMFYGLQEWQAAHGNSNGRVHTPIEFDNPVSPLLKRLAASIAVSAAAMDDEQKVELTAAAERCISIADVLNNWMQQKATESVFWIEVSGKRKQNVKLVCSPLDVGPVLRDELFNVIDSVVLTSATLSVGSNNFDFMKGRLGLTDVEEKRLGSPFDYQSQVKLIFPTDMPDPTGNARQYERAVCEKIKKYVKQTDGQAFVLFTSYQMLRDAARQLSPWFAEQKMSLFSQGDGLPRTLLLDKFRNQPRSVLFGTDSFWQGVDVPGDALQNVIIAKLPFSVPDHPLLEARIARIKQDGGNPFMEYQVPEAAIKLKQGFGRLIRSRSDSGQVVILDPRIRTKPYGRIFLKSLPDCQVIHDD